MSPAGQPRRDLEQIVKVAADMDADLIVMGTRGMTEWKSMLLGGSRTRSSTTHTARCRSFADRDLRLVDPSAPVLYRYHAADQKTGGRDAFYACVAAFFCCPGGTMSKTHRDLARMEKAAIEVDGEFCVPLEDGEVRHHIDLGPFLGDVQRPGCTS